MTPEQIRLLAYLDKVLDQIEEEIKWLVVNNRPIAAEELRAKAAVIITKKENSYV